jgi:hypothetical protein
MDDLLARCRSCGYEQEDEFSRCPVCFGSSSWWCAVCQSWCDSRSCPICGGALIVPAEILLGSFPAGARVPVQFSIRNPGRKKLEVIVSTSEPGLSILTRRLAVRPGEEVGVVGVLTLGMFRPGRRTFRIWYDTPASPETVLVADIIPTVVRLEFDPPEIVVKNAQPGKLLERTLTVSNAGNVHIVGALSATDAWLSVSPNRVSLAPGEAAMLSVRVRTRKTDFGLREAEIRIAPAEGYSASARVRVQLPNPKLEAEPVDFGEVLPERANYAAVALRNVGKVRVSCTLSADQPWLAVSPGRVNIPPGGEKVLKLRTVIPAGQAGPHAATLAVVARGKPLLSIPVALECRTPRPILGSIRKQTLGSIANDVAVVRRFRVANPGDGPLHCTVAVDQPWIEVHSRELEVPPGKHRRIEYLVRTPSMRPGAHQATIRIRSNGGDAAVPVSVVVVAPAPELQLLGDLDLGTVPDAVAATGFLAVRNSGVGMLTALASPEDSRVTVTPAEMTLAPGPPARLAVSVALAGLTGGWHSYAIDFASNGGSRRATVRLRVPIEQIQIPQRLDLGDCLAGGQCEAVVRVTNAGPDRVALAATAEGDWLITGADAFEVGPGESVSLSVRAAPRTGTRGPLTGTIHLQGRYFRQAITVQAVARTIEVVAIPQVIVLSNMRPGEERPIVLKATNRGDLSAEIGDLYQAGELEVWLRRQTVQPGATVPVIGRVRMRAKPAAAQVQATVRLYGGTSVHIIAKVAPQRLLRDLLSAALVAELTGAAALIVTGYRELAGIFAGLALISAGALLFVLGMRRTGPS